MLKDILITILTMIFGGLIVVGILLIFESCLSLLDIPFYTRLDDWSKHSTEESYKMIKDGFISILISFIFFKYIEPKLPKTKERKIKYAICPKCKETFYCKDLDNGK